MNLKNSSIVAACLIIPMFLTYTLDLTFKKYTSANSNLQIVDTTNNKDVIDSSVQGGNEELQEVEGNKDEDSKEIKNTSENEVVYYRLGDKGDKIKEIQRNLNKFNYKISVDGSFGGKTEWAVRDFQIRNRLPVDGVVGKETLYKLSLKPTKQTIYTPPKTGESAASSISNVEGIINSKNLSSSTGYLIWVNTNNQYAYIFTGSKNNWKLHKKMRCTTGKSSTPTVKGVFKIGGKGRYFRVNEKIICKYYTQFYKNYLFHTVLLNNDGKIVDGRLGRRLSHGCVRLAIENAKYIYDNIPVRTTVYVN